MHSFAFLKYSRAQSLTRFAVLLTIFAASFVVVAAGEANAAIVSVRPSQSLAAVANSHPRGTVFKLSSGTFQTRAVALQSGDKILGAGKSATFIRFSGTTGFDTTGASGVEIAFVDISGVSGTKSSCGKDCGRGISRGVNAFYHDLRSHNNSAMGIGGRLSGARLVNVELDHNGSSGNLGCCAAGVKSGTPFTITNSYVHDNIGNGIWCDVACGKGGPMNVLANRAVHNTLDGIHMEWSQGADATLKGNYVRQSGRFGIHIAQFGFASVLNNDIDGSRKSGISFDSSKRGEARGLSDGNRSDGITGCNLRYVTCR
jgi:hypothetical protein